MGGWIHKGLLFTIYYGETLHEEVITTGFSRDTRVWQVHTRSCNMNKYFQFMRKWLKWRRVITIFNRTRHDPLPLTLIMSYLPALANNLYYNIHENIVCNGSEHFGPACCLPTIVRLLLCNAGLAYQLQYTCTYFTQALSWWRLVFPGNLVFQFRISATATAKKTYETLVTVATHR